MSGLNYSTYFLTIARALVAFRASILDLAGMISPEVGLDESRPQDITSTETLMQIVNRLEDCSEKVVSLPEKGIFVSYQLMVETAFNQKNRAVGLDEKSLGNY